MDNPALPVDTSAIENRTVPLRRANGELRTREYLTLVEVMALVEAAKDNRQGHRAQP